MQPNERRARLCPPACPPTTARPSVTDVDDSAESVRLHELDEQVGGEAGLLTAAAGLLLVRLLLHGDSVLLAPLRQVERRLAAQLRQRLRQFACALLVHGALRLQKLAAAAVGPGHAAAAGLRR